jgi:hypothetical protein
MKAYGGMEGDWLTSRSLRFIPVDIVLRQQLDKRLGGSQSRSGRCGDEKNPFPLLGI